MPLLVRDDTHELLRARDVFPNYTPQSLHNHVTIVAKGDKPPAGLQQSGPIISEDLRNAWGDYVVYDTRSNQFKALSRDHVGAEFDKLGITPALEGAIPLKLVDGNSVTVRPVFDHIKTLVLESYDPHTVSEITWAPAEAIQSIARQIAQNAGKTLFALGMGPNQFFNNDLKDRAVFLLAALTRSIGRIGGNVGSYAGNYRAAYFNGLVNYFIEDPFHIVLDPQAPVQQRPYFQYESVHYWNHGDNILRAGKTLLTGTSHLPTPRKSIHVTNSNSLNVETKPYGGYPQTWDIKLLGLLDQRWKQSVYEGKTIFEEPPAGEKVTGHRPTESDYAYPNMGEDEVAGMVDKGAFFQGIHNVWMFYMARICNHCTYPGCAAACPRKAIYKRQEDGIVLVDQMRCRGYQECVKACPYKKVFFNSITRVSEKCIGCYPLIEQGMQPRCVTTCIGKIRLQGWLSTPGEAQHNNPIDQLVHIKKIALPIYPQYGTEPNVYYIPPLHVPREFLLQMFGPGVDAALQAYRNVPQDRQALAAMLLFGNTPYTISTYTYDDTSTVGYNDKGEEIIRVPLTEPFVVRQPYDERHKAYRLNTA